MTIPLLFIGLAGASGSGKTCLFHSLLDYFGSKNVTYFDMDGYHKHSRKERKQLNEYPEHPEANDFSRLRQDIQQLKSGNPIYIPTYNHFDGILATPIKREPKQLVVIEGLHALYLNDEDNIIDLSIFMFPEEALRKAWKVHRDVEKRFYEYDEVVKEINARDVYVRDYILQQASDADILVSIERVRNEEHLNFQVLLNQRFIKGNNSFRDLSHYLNLKKTYRMGESFYLACLKPDSDLVALEESFIEASFDIARDSLHLFGSKHNNSYQETVRILSIVILLMATYHIKGQEGKRETWRVS